MEKIVKIAVHYRRCQSTALRRPTATATARAKIMKHSIFYLLLIKPDWCIISNSFPVFHLFPSSLVSQVFFVLHYYIFNTFLFTLCILDNKG